MLFFNKWNNFIRLLKNILDSPLYLKYSFTTSKQQIRLNKYYYSLLYDVVVNVTTTTHCCLGISIAGSTPRESPESYLPCLFAQRILDLVSQDEDREYPATAHWTFWCCRRTRRQNREFSNLLSLNIEKALELKTKSRRARIRSAFREARKAAPAAVQSDQ